MQRNVTITAIMLVLALLAAGARAQADSYWTQLKGVDAEITTLDQALAKTGEVIIDQARRAKSLHRAFDLGRSPKRIAQGIEEVRVELKSISATLADVDAQIAQLGTALNTIGEAAVKLGDLALAEAAKETYLRLKAVQAESERQQTVIGKTAGSLDELEAMLNK